ncbi:MAG: hypothetical protein IBX69_19350 [Anaerolineales bacterium]|nr:hypothetical protein [Anaerolineales bacterium]
MKNNRSLYEILVYASLSGNEVTLTCDECFLIMEYLVDLAREGWPLDDIKKALFKHTNHCPDCYEHHLKRLKELEQQWHQL